MASIGLGVGEGVLVFFPSEISLGRMVIRSPIIVLNLHEHMKIYTIKENHIGPAASEILLYRQTDSHTSCYFSIKDCTCIKSKVEHASDGAKDSQHQNCCQSHFLFNTYFFFYKYFLGLKINNIIIIYLSYF